MAYNSKYTGAQVEAILDGAADKVDKVEGKGLSTNDYTDADKARVAAALTAHQQLKTVNGESLVGIGDIAIGGGSGGSAAFKVVDVGSTSTLSIARAPEGGYEYNVSINTSQDRVCYRVVASYNSFYGNPVNVTISGLNSDGSVSSDTILEWMIVINCGDDVPTMTWPSFLRWPNGEVMTMEVGYVHEFHIVASTFGAHIVGQKFKAVSA